MNTEPFQTALYSLHQDWGGKIVEFAGYALPIQYTNGGLLAEHHHTRQSASLFDVSHMGQLILSSAAAYRLNEIVPADVSQIAEGHAKYTQIINEHGGIVDDCIISNDGDRGYYIVVNASRKAIDIPLIQKTVGHDSPLTELNQHALIALQGPKSETVLAELVPDVTRLTFMQGLWCMIDGVECRIARCGYTGEDGFEISVPAENSQSIAQKLMDHPDVKPAGLGARDSLRLESGLCLYGNDLSEDTTPVEAGLTWSIPKHRRTNANFSGANVIQDQVENGVSKRLIGLLPEGKIPVRAHAPILCNGEQVGEVSSGSHSPTLGCPIAMGYVRDECKDQPLVAVVRNKEIPCLRTKLPFVPQNYKR